MTNNESARELILQILRTRMAFRQTLQRVLKRHNVDMTFEMLQVMNCLWNEQGISQQSLSRWQKELRESGDLKCRGSGNYSSDEAKEIARLKRELRDAKDALDVLKKAINILGE